MKTVLFAANTSWYLYNFRSSTIKRFVELGHRVICVSPYDLHSKKIIQLGAEHFDIPLDNKGINPFKDIVFVIRLFLIYKKFDPELIFHFTIKNNIYGSWAAFFARKKFVNNITGLGTIFIRENIISKLVYFMYRLSQPLAEAIFCQNKDDYDLLIRKNLVAKKKLQILPGSGVDLKKFSPKNLKNNKNKIDEPFIFIYSGRMIADKGLYELIAAMETINENNIYCHLWLCGFIDDKNVSSINISTIKSWAAYSWVNWIGESDSVNEILAECDCFVLPSYREGMPRSILEACAMSLPVIATDVPGCREIISHNFNGLLCNPGNVDSLKNTILKMLQLPENERKLMGERGRARVMKTYDELIVIQSAEDCFNRISNK